MLKEDTLRTLDKIENDIRLCDQTMESIRENSHNNIDEMFPDTLEKELVHFIYDTFKYYGWEQTIDAYNKSLEKFYNVVLRSSKNIVFVLHSESGLSNSMNNCHQKSGFFFTLLALKNASPSILSRVKGFICNQTYNYKIDKKQSNTIYCICEDSIYSGSQITSVIRNMTSKNKININDIHVVCPFVKEQFLQTGRDYTLHYEIPVLSLRDRLADDDVMNTTHTRLELEYTIDEVREAISSSFGFLLGSSMVYFAHKTADTVSIPLTILLGVFRLKYLPTSTQSESDANELVKNSNDSNPIWKCMRGPYKNYEEDLKRSFDDIFTEKFYPHKTLLSKCKSIIFKK